MKRIAPLLVALTAVALIAGCAGSQPMTHFGEPMQTVATEKPITVKQLITDAEEYEGKVVLVKGTITGMCEGSGCWVQLAADANDPEEEQVFVMLTYDQATHGRVPAEAKGQKAMLTGTVKYRVVTEEQRKHFAEVDGKSAEEVAAIKGSTKRVSIECPAIEVAGVKKAEINPCPHDDDEDDHGAAHS